MSRGFVVITGASGFVGGAVASVLLKAGYHIRCIYRRRSIPKHLRDLAKRGAQIVQSDLSAPGALHSLFDGAYGLVHAAALASDWGSDEMFRRANIDMTRRVFKAAKLAGVNRGVFVGSLAVMGFGSHIDTTEQGVRYPYVNSYQSSKAEAEKWCLDFGRKAGMNIVIVRPGNIYGPGDTTTWYPLLKGLKKGIIPYLSGGASLTCPVYIDDVAESIRLVIECPESVGEAFNITGGERITWKDQFHLASDALGVPAPYFNIPSSLARIMSTGIETIYITAGIRRAPPLTRYRVDQLTHNYHFSISKAVRILGYNPKTAFDEGIRRTVDAYLAFSK